MYICVHNIYTGGTIAPCTQRDSPPKAVTSASPVIHAPCSQVRCAAFSRVNPTHIRLPCFSSRAGTRRGDAMLTWVNPQYGRLYVSAPPSFFVQ